MVTNNQYRRLLDLMNRENNLEKAALKAGMDVKTARKYVKSGVSQAAFILSASLRSFCIFVFGPPHRAAPTNTNKQNPCSPGLIVDITRSVCAV